MVAVFWDAILCGLAIIINISKEPAATIFRAE
jgi:hypothetical protein